MENCDVSLLLAWIRFWGNTHATQAICNLIYCTTAMYRTDYNINSLWPFDAICLHKSGSPLARIMACCLTESRHYLNQCWIIILRSYSHQCNFTENSQDICHWYEIRLQPHLPGSNDFIHRYLFQDGNDIRYHKRFILQPNGRRPFIRSLQETFFEWNICNLIAFFFIW